MEPKTAHEIKDAPSNVDIHHTPGICIMRGILTFEEQLHFINIITSKGELKDINGEWNFFGLRGRKFDNLNNYDDFIKLKMQEIKTIVECQDETLIWAPLSHM